MIYSGNLTEHLDFYEVVETQSASGYKSEEERFKFSCRAQRLKNKEDYVVDAEQLFHISHLTFKMRAQDIKDSDLVVYEGERYRITSMDRFRKELTIIIEKMSE